MARPRVELQTLLKEYCDTVYFQPPSSIRINYPCIVYNRSTDYLNRANNSLYMKEKMYRVTVMDKNPDSDIADRLQELPWAVIISRDVIDNIYQTTLNIYY